MTRLKVTGMGMGTLSTLLYTCLSSQPQSLGREHPQCGERQPHRILKYLRCFLFAILDKKVRPADAAVTDSNQSAKIRSVWCGWWNHIEMLIPGAISGLYPQEAAPAGGHHLPTWPRSPPELLHAVNSAPIFRKLQSVIFKVWRFDNIQGDFWLSTSGIDLLQACFESSEVLKGIYRLPQQILAVFFNVT